jgi:hypothetical protein
MNKGKYVFAQIVTFLPQRVFDTIVSKYDGDYKVRHFSCWNQMLCMMYGQLANRDSLSDLILAINAHASKSYHMGFGKGVSKANLARSNANRCHEIFSEFATHLTQEARRLCVQYEEAEFSFSNPVYAFDSTTIDLCLNVFWWAGFRKAKGAVKLHTQYDVRTSIPVLVDLTKAAVHDVNAMDKITYEPGSFYVFDRGYLDFKRLYAIHELKSFFVIRAKTNLRFKRQKSFAANKGKGIVCDQIGILTGFYSSKGYPERIRRIRFYDQGQNRTFLFLTNNMELSAVEIALLYKYRWQIELFLNG